MTGSLAKSATAHGDLLKPGFILGTTPGSFGGNLPMQAALQRTPLPEALKPVTAPEPAAQIASIDPALPLPAASATIPLETSEEADAGAAQAISTAIKGFPMPAPRPAELKLPATAESAIPLRQPTRRARAAASPAPVAAAQDNRSFFEKLFGAPRQPNGPAMAYAAPEDDVVDRSRGRRLSPSLGPASGPASAGTAVYDISARTVYMPNGERLEAHSGLGDKMDDVRFVHVRMKGATPPHTYTLTEREALFHGTRALRMHPVGGSKAIYGRAGLLTHPYLLGPRGDSNGCVSFKDYDRFLQAYLRGEVKRLVVVASLN
ncbi:hypothetical protein ASE63_15090 [Bosea sp. Root381]|nr:hypothetical protein ASE63_15090 [Bosea sp. Root381]